MGVGEGAEEGDVVGETALFVVLFLLPNEELGRTDGEGELLLYGEAKPDSSQARLKLSSLRSST